MTKSKTKPQKVYPAEFKTLFERADKGDLTVMPELKKLFDENKDFVGMLGDLVQHAEKALLSLAAGKNLLAREAIERSVEELRERLMAITTSPVDRLLVDRIVISWMEVYIDDIKLVDFLVLQPTNIVGIKAAAKRLDQAHARFLKAVKALAIVQKLLTPARSPLEIATALEGRMPKLESKRDRRLAIFRGEGVPVEN